MTIGIILLALTVAGAPPALQINASANEPAAQAAKDEPKPICRRYAPVGSNIARRKICMSKTEWDQMARSSQALGRSMLPALTLPGVQ